MFKKLKNLMKAVVTVAQNKDLPPEQRPKTKKQKEVEKTVKELHLEKLAKEKAIATERGEPWVAIVNMDVDQDNLSNGSFELDWNDAFVTRLMRFGYQGKTDSDMVDQWFTDVCRNVVLETYEQGAADLHPVKSVDLGNGRREYR